MIYLPRNTKSRPARGAWIETRYNVNTFFEILSRPARGAWIETSPSTATPVTARSRPARGAWIETSRGIGSVPITRGAWIETEKLGGRIVKSSATFPYRMLFHLGLKKLLPCVKIG